MALDEDVSVKGLINSFVSGKFRLKPEQEVAVILLRSRHNREGWRGSRKSEPLSPVPLFFSHFFSHTLPAYAC